jgi:hypothetical protein
MCSKVSIKKFAETGVWTNEVTQDLKALAFKYYQRVIYSCSFDDDFFPAMFEHVMSKLFGTCPSTGKPYYDSQKSDLASWISVVMRQRVIDLNKRHRERRGETREEVIYDQLINQGVHFSDSNSVFKQESLSLERSVQVRSTLLDFAKQAFYNGVYIDQLAVYCNYLKSDISAPILKAFVGYSAIKEGVLNISKEQLTSLSKRYSVSIDKLLAIYSLVGNETPIILDILFSKESPSVRTSK